MRALACLCGLSIALAAPRALAAGERSRFEPTDLELERGGVLDIDLQVGTFRGDPARPIVTDLELDLGLTRGVELNVDGAFYSEGAVRGGGVRADPLWTSMKLGLVDGRDRPGAFGVGVQLGPRWSLARTERGLGYEALVIVERSFAPLRVAVSTGGIVDPPTNIHPAHATGIELGVDVVTALSARWSILTELGFLRFLSRDPHQAYGTFGFSNALTSYCDVHAIALVGFTAAGDRLGVLFGVSPKIALLQ